MGIRVSPITDSDVARGGGVPASELYDAVPAEAWARAVDVPWKVDAPNHGFQLRTDDGAVVVSISPFIPTGRSMARPPLLQSGRLVRAARAPVPQPAAAEGLLAQGCDLTRPVPPAATSWESTPASVSGSLDTATALVPQPALAVVAGGGTVTGDRRTIERSLSGGDLRSTRTTPRLRGGPAPAAVRGGVTCHVIFRKDRRKGLPLFALHPVRERSRPVPAHGPAGVPSSPAAPRHPGDPGGGTDRRGRLLAGRLLSAPRRKMVLGAGSRTATSTTSTANSCPSAGDPPGVRRKEEATAHRIRLPTCLSGSAARLPERRRVSFKERR
jgi:hypothetical protein